MISHFPVNNFNVDQVSSYLNNEFSDLLTKATSSDETVSLYKPTSGAWTTSKLNSGTNARVLTDLAKSLKTLESQAGSRNTKKK